MVGLLLRRRKEPLYHRHTARKTSGARSCEGCHQVLPWQAYRSNNGDAAERGLKPARTKDMKQTQTLPIAEAAPLGIGFEDLLAGVVATWRTRAKNLRTMNHPRHPHHADDAMQAQGLEECAADLERILPEITASKSLKTALEKIANYYRGDERATQSLLEVQRIAKRALKPANDQSSSREK